MNKMGTLRKHKAELFISFHGVMSGYHLYVIQEMKLTLSSLINMEPVN